VPVVYDIECLWCGKRFELDHPSEPQPEHNRKDYDALRCNGSGLVGKPLGQKYKPD